MSTGTSAANELSSIINGILDPRLNQVIGSTPKSLETLVEKSGLANDRRMGAKFIGVALFAAAVNGKALGEMIVDSELADLRARIGSSFTINNKFNMTALSLAGHCFLTSKLVDQIKFAVEFRKKMGQDHLWAGDLSSGSLSDAQKKIMKEKIARFTHDEAKGFVTYFVGAIGLKAGKSGNQDPGKPIPPPPRGTTPAVPGALPTDVVAFALKSISQDELNAYVAQVGAEDAINYFRGQMATS